METWKENVSSGRLAEIKSEIIKYVLDFIGDELEGDELDGEQKESLLVAKQCIEACYDLEDKKLIIDSKLMKVFHSCNIPKTSEEQALLDAEAEKYKVVGNERMKEGDYTAALNCYSKAINANRGNAIYYCNRAAAYSRLEMHREAILDCKEAIKLDPTYGKAYGRLGIAYSNLTKYREAAEAYRKALELDPSNSTYEANLKLAEEKVAPSAAAQPMIDFGGFMNNPALLNMASQMLNDPTFRNMVSGIMTGGPGGDPNLESFVQASQQLAEHMQVNNPEMLENLRHTFGQGGPQDNPDQGPPPQGNGSGGQPNN